MLDEPRGDDWVAVTDEPLELDVATRWAIMPDCGGLVSFCGTVRDFSEGRDEVSALEYEAFPEQVVPRLSALCAAARATWPEIGRIVLWHRVGRMQVGEAAVLVCASTPHRREAFDAAEYLIDTLKATAPIWKLETWANGSEWSEGTCDIEEVSPPTALAAPRPHGGDHDHAHQHDADDAQPTRLDAGRVAFGSPR